MKKRTNSYKNCCRIFCFLLSEKNLSRKVLAQKFNVSTFSISSRLLNGKIRLSELPFLEESLGIKITLDIRRMSDSPTRIPNYALENENAKLAPFLKALLRYNIGRKTFTEMSGGDGALLRYYMKRDDISLGKLCEFADLLGLSVFLSIEGNGASGNSQLFIELHNV